MTSVTNAWQCDCGHIEHSTYPPQECNECWKLNSFNTMEEDDLMEDFE